MVFPSSTAGVLVLVVVVLVDENVVVENVDVENVDVENVDVENVVVVIVVVVVEAGGTASEQGRHSEAIRLGEFLLARPTAQHGVVWSL